MEAHVEQFLTRLEVEKQYRCKYLSGHGSYTNCVVRHIPGMSFQRADQIGPS